MKKFLLGLGLVLIACNRTSHGPENENIIYHHAGGQADDICRTITRNADDTFTGIGWTRSFSAERWDLWLIQIDAGGELMRQHHFGSTGNDYGYDILRTSSGDFVLCGITADSSNVKHLFVTKISAQWHPIWSMTLENASSAGIAIQETFGGGFLIAGHTDGGCQKYSDILIVKIDADGVLLWEKTLGSQYDEFVCAIEQTPDAGFLISAYTNPSLYQSGEVILLKIDENGDELWEKLLTSSGKQGASVLQTFDGGFALAGHADNNAQLLSKFDFNGEEQWKIQVGENQNIRIFDLIQTADQGFAAVGYLQNSTATITPVLVKFSQTGERLWSQDIEVPGGGVAYTVRQNADNSFMVAGETNTTDRGKDAFFIRIER